MASIVLQCFYIVIISWRAFRQGTLICATSPVEILLHGDSNQWQATAAHSLYAEMKSKNPSFSAYFCILQCTHHNDW